MKKKILVSLLLMTVLMFANVTAITEDVIIKGNLTINNGIASLYTPDENYLNYNCSTNQVVKYTIVEEIDIEDVTCDEFSYDKLELVLFAVLNQNKMNYSYVGIDDAEMDSLLSNKLDEKFMSQQSYMSETFMVSQAQLDECNAGMGSWQVKYEKADARFQALNSSCVEIKHNLEQMNNDKDSVAKSNNMISFILAICCVLLLIDRVWGFNNLRKLVTR